MERGEAKAPERENAIRSAAAPSRDTDFVEALARGLNVLGVFSDAAREGAHARLTLTDVAKRTDLSRGTARRLLLTLRALQYLESDGKYFWPTPKVLSFADGFLAPLGLGDGANAVIKALTEEVNESSSVAVLDGEDVVYVARVEVRRIYSSRIVIGSRIPAHCSALGRALLAQMEPSALDLWLRRHPLSAMTPCTITCPEAFRAELLKIRADGYAIIDEELELGIRSAAVPILGRGGRAHGAINIGSSTARSTRADLEERFVPSLTRSAARLAQFMDW